MKQALDRRDAIPLAEKVYADLEAAYEDITALDAQIGDGDLGVTCRLGMHAVLESLPQLTEAPVDQMVLKAGMAFNSAGASTFGALVASAAMRVAKYAKENAVETWELPVVVEALKAAVEGIEHRGKAERGQKTVLDALWPAIDALEAAREEGKALPEAMEEAAQAAEEGVEATKPLKSQYGRAAWLQDKTVGVPDPGATVAAVVFRAVAQYCQGDA